MRVSESFFAPVRSHLEFRAPEIAADVHSMPFSNLRMYTGKEMILSLTEQARNRNESLGLDMSFALGRVVINGFPIIRLDQLDNENLASQFSGNQTNMLIALNHSHFMAAVQDGEWFREFPPESADGVPDTLTTYVDVSYNFLCKNRRTQGIISRDIT